MKVISSSVGDIDAVGTKGSSSHSDAGEDNIAQGELSKRTLAAADGGRMEES